MGLIAANKRFLWAGVGAPGSVHDSTLLQSAPIFHQIESGHVLPHNVLTLPGHGEIPLVMVGDSAFPARPWLLKAYPDTTKNQKERYFNKKLRSARVVSEHAYGMLKGRFRMHHIQKGRMSATQCKSCYHGLYCTSQFVHCAV